MASTVTEAARSVRPVGPSTIRTEVLVDANVVICADGTPGVDVVVGAMVVAVVVVEAVTVARAARTFTDRRAESAGAETHTTAAASPRAQPAMRRCRRRLSFMSSGSLGSVGDAPEGVVKQLATGGGP